MRRCVIKAACLLALLPCFAKAQEKAEVNKDSKKVSQAEPKIGSKATEPKNKRENLPVTSKPKAGEPDAYGRKPAQNYGYPQPEGQSYQYSYSYSVGMRNGVPIRRYGNAQASVTVNGQTQSVQSNSSGGQLGAKPTTEQLMRMKRNFVFDAGDKMVRIFHTPRLIRLRVKGKERRAKEKVYSARDLATLKKNDPEAYKLYIQFLPGLPEDDAKNQQANGTVATDALMQETIQKMEQTSKGAPIINQLIEDLRNKSKR